METYHRLEPVLKPAPERHTVVLKLAPTSEPPPYLPVEVWAKKVIIRDVENNPIAIVNPNG